MKLILTALAAVGLAAFSTAAPSLVQRGDRSANVLPVPTAPGIAWFGTWKEGLAEAKRTNRPILLMSAAPQCHGVPGMW
ncbi:MAG: hypothetical protein P1V35_13405 [Planctomycetota bacterium]|nr:hypothetical protein [Planctomycetota bacterium]